MTRLVRKEDKGPVEVKVGSESKWICMCGLSSNQLSVTVHTKRQQTRRQAKFIDIILMEPELKHSDGRNQP
jgi:hypothetical protein